jgi:FMN phosphatase YigB (HAD superfamily)
LILLSKAVADRGDLVDELGLTSHFAEIVFASEKTDALFDGIAEKHGADKACSWVIGDRAQGELKFGHRGGWQTIWLRAGKFADELPAAAQQPDYTVSNLAQVLALI